MTDEVLLQAAMTAARAGDLETAAVLFARLVKEDPVSEQGWLGLGFCFSDNNRREYCFRRVLTINPDNSQAKQALGLLESSVPSALPATRLQSHPQTATEIPKPAPKPTQASPFFSENVPAAEKEQPAFMQAMQANAVTPKPLAEGKPNDKAEAPVSVSPQPASQGTAPTGPLPEPKRKVKPLVVVLLLAIIPLLICVAGIGYLLLTGRAAAMLQANPVPLPTLAPSSTPTATYTPTITPSATPSPTPAPPTPTSSPTIQPTLVYTPVFAKVACRFAPPKGVVVTCGFVSVPEDRTNQHSNTIQLAVAIFHSTSPNPDPDPVIFLQGGPGGQAVMLSADDFPVLVRPFLSKRDYIAFDQRGTGLSVPALDCDELENVYKQDIGGQIPASSRDYIYTNAFRSCHDAMTVTGIELNSYTTLASSDDLKDIVTALGYKQVNLYSASYGTRLALVTMRNHPEIVRSVVLDSVVPVETKLFNEDPVRYGSALQALFDGCAADSHCNAAYPDLKTVFWNLVDQLDTKPATVNTPLSAESNTESFDGGYLINVILGLLKSTEGIAYAPQTIYSIKSGDYSTFVDTQSSLPYEFEDINLGLYISMTCHEQVLATTPQDLQASRNSQDDQSVYYPLPFFNDAQTLFNACKMWGSVPPAPGENDAVVSAIPALIIEGKYDPATPPIFGKQVAANLSHSYYMEFPNQGHTPTATDTSSCASSTMLAFFDNPQLAPDMTCLLSIKGVDFITP
ncbi:MAG: alpha/beta fold hydrolase [Anaerolineales bacterium]